MWRARKMKLDSNAFDRWVEWAGKIKSDLMNIVNNQQIYNQFEEIVSANWSHFVANDGQLFYNFVKECYGVQAALGVRRHIKIDDDSISLMKLLNQISVCSKQFTYDFYVKRYPIDPSYVEWQKSTFKRFSEDGLVVSEAIITHDMQELEKIAGAVGNFVDRTMAHLDKRGPSDDVTYADLKSSIDLFNKMVCRYLALITGDGYVSLQPTIQFNWKRIFSVPFDVRKQ
jgi:hypothetical protein